VLFRWLFIAIFLSTFFVSGYFRRRARQSGETIARVREGRATLLARLLLAAPLYLSLLAFMLNPSWMSWSSLPLPDWARWVGVAVGLSVPALIYWIMISIGKNISETYLTKESHQLVRHGPYRWIRHPLYSVATLAFAALGVIAANWFMLAMALIVFGAIAMLVVPREEAELVRKFGDEYREYQRRTDRFIPRLSPRR
jgi:protein-S-isoprenylcysteine O-methyltransferase Ste14